MDYILKFNRDFNGVVKRAIGCGDNKGIGILLIVVEVNIFGDFQLSGCGVNRKRFIVIRCIGSATEAVCDSISVSRLRVGISVAVCSNIRVRCGNWATDVCVSTRGFRYLNGGGAAGERWCLVFILNVDGDANGIRRRGVPCDRWDRWCAYIYPGASEKLECHRIGVFGFIV